MEKASTPRSDQLLAVAALRTECRKPPFDAPSGGYGSIRRVGATHMHKLIHLSSTCKPCSVKFLQSSGRSHAGRWHGFGIGPRTDGVLDYIDYEGPGSLRYRRT